MLKCIEIYMYLHLLIRKPQNRRTRGWWQRLESTSPRGAAEPPIGHTHGYIGGVDQDGPVKNRLAPPPSNIVKCIAACPYT